MLVDVPYMSEKWSHCGTCILANSLQQVTSVLTERSPGCLWATNDPRLFQSDLIPFVYSLSDYWCPWENKKDGILEYAITCGHHFPFPASSKNSHFFQLIFLPVLPLSYNDKCPVELCTIHQNTHQPTECLLLMGLKIIPLWISKCHSLPYQCDATQTQRRFNNLQTHTHTYIYLHTCYRLLFLARECSLSIATECKDWKVSKWWETCAMEWEDVWC